MTWDAERQIVGCFERLAMGYVVDLAITGMNGDPVTAVYIDVDLILAQSITSNMTSFMILLANFFESR